MMKVTK